MGDFAVMKGLMACVERAVGRYYFKEDVGLKPGLALCFARRPRRPSAHLAGHALSRYFDADFAGLRSMALAARRYV